FYMACNIGANDVANSMASAVGANAITLRQAIFIAGILNIVGATFIGSHVTNTIRKGIVSTDILKDPQLVLIGALSALLSASLWVSFATWRSLPVSTTHSIVGGVMGAGIAAAGFYSVNWPTMGSIAASWVISPILGGIIAAGFLAFIKTFIIYQDDKIAAARRWVPVLIGVMAGAFASYLALKGLKKIIKIDMPISLVIGAIVGAIVWQIMRPIIRRQSEGMENRNQSLRTLFSVPLVCSAALLSFAHGANDVANAVGPLAAIVHTAELGDVASKVSIPLWVMAVGAFGISFGLLLFGPKLIAMVGQQITKLNPMRAYCVSLSAAITVIIASGLGLPVSSTHIAVGAVFGVGFFREWFTERSKLRLEYVNKHDGTERKEVRPVRNREEQARRHLVRRAHFMTIVAAWVVTVPAAAVLSAALYFVMVKLIA
ncbi:inorganic phosphate transporter, partial [Roseibium sp.]|uniref:inorganic phosphate transporter n=1 Tax=Roseibium sp. TaxID=1936156 RepID=UPI003D14BA03